MLKGRPLHKTYHVSEKLRVYKDPKSLLVCEGCSLKGTNICKTHERYCRNKVMRTVLCRHHQVLQLLQVCLYITQGRLQPIPNNASCIGLAKVG